MRRQSEHQHGQFLGHRVMCADEPAHPGIVVAIVERYRLEPLGLSEPRIETARDGSREPFEAALQIAGVLLHAVDPDSKSRSSSSFRIRSLRPASLRIST